MGVGDKFGFFFDIFGLRFLEVIRMEFSVRLMDYLSLPMWEPTLASRWLLSPWKWARLPERKREEREARNEAPRNTNI